MMDDRALSELKAMRTLFKDVGADPALVDAEWSLPDEQEPEVTTTRRWVGDLVRAIDWRREGKHRARWFPLPREHVNLSEHRALRTTVRQLIKEGTRDARVLACVDSNVVVGACSKGRSRSMALRRLQQGLVAELLFYNLYIGVLPVDTHDNLGWGKASRG